MKNLLSALGLVLVGFNVNAQKVAATVGAKMQVMVAIKSTTTVTQMGQDMEIPSTSEMTDSFEVKSASDKEMALKSVAKRIKVSVTLMGNEQNLDSDDPASANNPQMAEVFKDINKPKDITVELGKATFPVDASSGVPAANDIASILYTPFSATAKEGANLTDSATNADGSKIVNVYTLQKVTPQEITVMVTSKGKIIGTKQQMGMDVKLNMESSSTATRVYSATNGLLISEAKSFSASGNNEMMGQTIPVSSKGSSTITVK